MYILTLKDVSTVRIGIELELCVVLSYIFVKSIWVSVLINLVWAKMV